MENDRWQMENRREEAIWKGPKEPQNKGYL